MHIDCYEDEENHDNEIYYFFSAERRELGVEVPPPGLREILAG